MNPWEELQIGKESLDEIVRKQVFSGQLFIVWVLIYI